MCVRKTKGALSHRIFLWRSQGPLELCSESEPMTLLWHQLYWGKPTLHNSLLLLIIGTKFLSRVMQTNPLLKAMGVPVILLIKTKT